jgi:hypothetical protein
LAGRVIHVRLGVNRTMTGSKLQRYPPAENSGSELDEPRWSVVSFDAAAVNGQTYREAVEWIKKLNEQKISGLCVITDEAAGRVGEKPLK